jgi:hypothetical protein
MVARSLNLNAVTVNAVPEQRVATILGLPGKFTSKIVQVGVDGDPIYNERL